MSTETADTQAPPLAAEPSTSPSHFPPAGDNTQNGNLEKIRDILFGAQVRDHDRRFSALEQNLAKEAAALKAELTKRFDSLEAFMQQEVAILSSRLQQEQQARGEAMQHLVRDLTSLGAVVERNATSLVEQAGHSERTLRQEILGHVSALNDIIRSTQDQLSDSLNRSVADLRHAKTDRTALAELLAELSHKLQQGSPTS
ncbi:MAG: hypothetical protein LZF86_210034 [Nitrospira sp.]|nr:MAG: hypothetical protein LZF86_210034 [Nitrospira sp.]